MKKRLALILALVFYVSILPPLSSAAVIKGNFSDIITKGPWVDVRAYGAVAGDNTDAVKSANVVAIKAAIDAATAAGTWLDFAGKTFYTNATIQARDKYVTPLRLRNGEIHGYNIDGPVLNIGGSKVTFDDMTINGDSVWFAVVAYRTTTYNGSFITALNSKFVGRCSKAVFYAIGVEVNDYVNSGFYGLFNAPVYLATSTDILSVASVLPDFVGVQASNTVTHWRGGYVWAIPESSPTTACTGIRITRGDNYNISDVSFYQAENCSGIWLGDDTADSGSIYGINIVGNRTEGSDSAGPFVRIKAPLESHAVSGLRVVGNDVFNAALVVGAEDNVWLVNADIGPNSTLTGTYALGTFFRGRVFSPDSAVAFASTSGQSPMYSTVIAKNITYAAGTVTNPGQSIHSDVTIYNSTDASLQKEYLSMRAVAVAPLYSQATHSGVFAVPDGTSWNPAGLGNKPAFLLESEDNTSLAWFQVPVIKSMTPPSTKTDACTIGQITFSSTYFYHCYADNNWRRTAIDNTW